MPLRVPKKVGRLTAMPPAEIFSRVRQAVAKQLDARSLQLPSFRHPPLGALTAKPNFFFGAGDIASRLELICAHVPDFEGRVLQQAGAILQNRIPLLGYGVVDCGRRIDWQRDIISGKQAPFRPWPKIRYLDFNEVGDSKVSWELSRHQFLVTLAKAWKLTGQERYISKLEELFDDWQAGNPYPMGITWASSLEVAFRSLSWIWVRELVRGHERGAKLDQQIADALGFNAWYIERYLSTYFSPNTHLQGEAVALFFIGTLCPGFSQATAWRELGWNLLLEHAQSKVREDGAYFEQSTYYHVYALDFFLHARVLAERNAMEVPPAFDRAIRAMLGFLSALCQAGPPPRFGDDDGGRLFDATRNLACHLRDPLVMGCGLFDGGAWKQEGVGATEEMLWLLGDEGLRRLAARGHAGASGSTAFLETGVFILSDPDRQGCQAVFDVGPLGGGSGGHGHADTLAVNLNIDGYPMLVDRGACVYVGAGNERSIFRGTLAHNTVTVDGRSQAEPKTAFSWHRWPEARQEECVLTNEFDWVAGSHDGYAQLASPVTHRRAVLRTGDGFWVVIDRLVTLGKHDYDMRWQLAPGTEAGQMLPQSWLVKAGRATQSAPSESIGGGQGPRQLLVRSHAPGWTGSIGRAGHSSAYGKLEEAPLLNLVKRGGGNEALITLLWPFAPSDPLPDISLLVTRPDVSAWQICCGPLSWLLCVGTNEAQFEVDGWRSDGSLLCVKQGSDGKTISVLATGCTHVRSESAVLLAPGGRHDHYFWVA